MTQAPQRAERIQVKRLNGISMMCEVSGCDSPASFLFRSGNGPIAAYCERHGRESASRQGLAVPEPVEKALAGW